MPEPRPCVVCGRPSAPEFRPFCSKRCADVDLARWFRGDYAIPAAADEEDEAGTPPPSAPPPSSPPSDED